MSQEASEELCGKRDQQRARCMFAFRGKRLANAPHPRLASDAHEKQYVGMRASRSMNQFAILKIALSDCRRVLYLGETHPIGT